MAWSRPESRPTVMRECPKCKHTSGDDWDQCDGKCPVECSPHFDLPTHIWMGGLRDVKFLPQPLEPLREVDTTTGLAMRKSLDSRQCMACERGMPLAQSRQVNMEKYEHSVIRVCESLHGHITGSSDMLAADVYSRLVRWLEWRVLEGWDPSRMSPAWAKYDHAIRQLALATLAMCAEHER